MPHLVTVVGARPQFIKAAALSRQLLNSSLKETLIHTGQHFDKNMSNVFFEELEIPQPKYFLDIHSQSHAEMTARMLMEIEKILVQESPDAVLVYGDTNSTLAGALAAAKLHIPVIHIEAGLRSFNRKMPEEINRVLTDHLSSLLFCPTQTSVDNLKKEGIEKGVHLAGDVMYDATLYAKDFIKRHPEILNKFSFINERFALVTIHRAESTENLLALEKCIHFIAAFAREHGLLAVFPVHPRTRKLMEKVPRSDQMLCLEPTSYFETQALLSHAKYVLTDSGGLQKEAYFHRVPCITLRSETEWVETVTSGWNQLWGSLSQIPRSEISDYGTGNAASEIIRSTELFLNAV